LFTRGFKRWCETVAAQRRRELGLRPTDPLDPILLAASFGVEVHSADEVPDLDRELICLVSTDQSFLENSALGVLA